MRRPRSLLLPLLAALCAACDGYPDGWASVDHGPLGLVRFGCPDLTGTYRLHPGKGLRAYGQSIIDRQAQNARRQRWHWETITISGNARDSLHLTLRRSQSMVDEYHAWQMEQLSRWERDYRRLFEPQVRWRASFASMDDSAYSANLVKLSLDEAMQVTLRPDEHYACDGGWLVADRLVHDPGPDRSRPRPDTVIGVVRLARDRKGFLVFDAKYKEEVEFAIWCGDGCRGVPLGRWTMHDWSHLEPAEPPAPVIRSTTWSDPFAPPPVRPISGAHAPLQTVEEVRALLQPFVKAPLELGDVLRDGGGYRAMVRSPAGTAAFHGMFEPLGRARVFPTVEVVGLEPAPAAPAFVLSLRLALVSRATATAPESIEARLRSLLPRSARIEQVRRSGPSFFVTVVFRDQVSYGAALRAVAADGGFEDPEVYEATRVGATVRAVLRLRERIAP